MTVWLKLLFLIGALGATMIPPMPKAPPAPPPIRRQIETFYVATTGDNAANTCAEALLLGTPKRTIQAGIDCLSGGDVLEIRAGTYNESGLDDIPPGISVSQRTIIQNFGTELVIVRPTDIGTPLQTCPTGGMLWTRETNYVAIIGRGTDARAGMGTAPVHTFRLDGNFHCSALLYADNDPVDSITIRGQLYEGVTFENSTRSGMLLEGTDTIFRNNVCQHIGFNDQDHCVYGGVLINGIFEDNFFYEAAAYGMQLQPPGSTGNATNNVFRRNLCVANGSACLLVTRNTLNTLVANNISIGDADGGVDPFRNKLAYDTGWGGFRVGGGPNDTELKNNTIISVQNGKPGIILTDGSVDRTVMCGNIIWNSGNNNQVLDISTGTASLGCNALSVNLSNFSSNPLFTNMAARDLTLLAGSLAIDTSFLLTGDFTDDYNGDIRPIGAGYDFGAYESGQPPDNPPLFTEVYVDVDCAGCDGTGDGTFADPYQTFDEGITHLQTEGTLYMRGRATHYPTDINCDAIPNGTVDAYTTIRGYPEDALFPRITPTSGVNSLLADNSCQFVTFQSIRFFGTNISGDVISVDSDVRFVQVSAEAGPADCWQINGDDNTFTGGGADTCVQNGYRVAGDRNIIASGGTAGTELDISGHGGDGVLIATGADDNEVNSVVSSGNGGNGVLSTGLRALIQGNLLVDNTADGADVSGNNSEVVYNLTYSNTGIGVHISGGTGALVANNANCINGTALTDGGAGTTLTTNNATCDASDFINPPVFDFNLELDSDLINAGTLISGYPLIDYYGGERTVGAAPDIGPIEVQSTGTAIDITSLGFGDNADFVRGRDTLSVAWTTTGITGNLVLSYSLDGGGGLYYRIGVVAFDSSPYVWDLDGMNIPASANVVLKLEQGVDVGFSDIFTIHGEYLR